jgi:membrane fusion protein, multidrug efflux system
MKNTKSYLAATWKCMALLISTTYLLSACGGPEEVPATDFLKSVKTMIVSSNAVMNSREFPGRVKSSQSANLSFRISGPLIELSVSSGQKVTVGEVLAKIDPRYFQSKVDNVNSAIEEANAQLTAMKKGAREEDIKVLEATLASARATYNEASAQYDRFKQLFEEDVGTRAAVDTQLKVRDVALAEVDKATQQLKSGKAGARKEDLDAMQARIEGLQAQQREAKASLSDTELKAPFAGVVAKKFVDNFEDIQAKQSILSLQDDSAIEIVINISERAMGRGNTKLTISEIAESLDARAKFIGVSDSEFKITLKDYETEADSVTQTFAVTFSMQTPDDVNILSGMNAIVYTEGKSLGPDERTSITVPLGAVFADSAGNETVWKIDPASMKVAPIAVKTGSMAGTSVTIVTGLSIGDMIVTSAANSLREGMTVRSMNSGSSK